MTKQIRIIDIKVNNGVMYCSAQTARERCYEILDAQDVLWKIAQNFRLGYIEEK